MVGHGRAAGGTNFRHHLVGSRSIGPFALGAATQIIHHHLRTVAGKQQRMGATKTTTGASDHYHLAFKPDRFAHVHYSTVSTQKNQLTGRAVSTDARVRAMPDSALNSRQ
jgi:hypothetical protein